MSGEEDKAIGILEMAMRKAQEEEKSFEAYEIQMLLVEMLIYKVFIYFTSHIFYILHITPLLIVFYASVPHKL